MLVKLRVFIYLLFPYKVALLIVHAIMFSI